MPSSAAVGERTSASRSRAGSAASSTAYDEEEEATLRPPQVLARKLTCSVLTVVFMGGFLIILLQVGLTLTAVPDWSADAKQAMIDLEQENILKLASDKADYVDEIFGRVKEGLLQLQEFAGQALVAVPQTIVVDQYLMAYPGLEQSGTTWDHSSW